MKETFLLKSRSSNVFPAIFFLEICWSLRTKISRSERLVLENYVLAYHTADKDHAKDLDKDHLSFFVRLT